MNWSKKKKYGCPAFRITMERKIPSVVSTIVVLETAENLDEAVHQAEISMPSWHVKEVSPA